MNKCTSGWVTGGSGSARQQPHRSVGTPAVDLVTWSGGRPLEGLLPPTRDTSGRDRSCLSAAGPGSERPESTSSRCGTQQPPWKGGPGLCASRTPPRSENESRYGIWHARHRYQPLCVLRLYVSTVTSLWASPPSGHIPRSLSVPLGPSSVRVDASASGRGASRSFGPFRSLSLSFAPLH